MLTAWTQPDLASSLDSQPNLEFSRQPVQPWEGSHPGITNLGPSPRRKTVPSLGTLTQGISFLEETHHSPSTCP